MHANVSESTQLPHTEVPCNTTLALLALAVGSFGIGTTEFGPMGMLQNIAEGVNVSIPSAGLLISAYAIGVMLGAPFMTLFLSKWPRRKALMTLMAIFTLGNLLSAISPNYASLMAARVVTSLNHGAFFGIGAVVAASLVPREKQASAVALMFAGLTIANIGGVPAATWISQMLGWRESFAAIAGLGLLSIIALRFALPIGSKGTAPNIAAELKVLTRPVVVQGLLTTVTSSGAMFTLYTYINPALKLFTEATPLMITGMLALTGVGFTIGNTVGGKMADMSIRNTLIGCLVLEAISLAAFPFVAGTVIGAAIGLFIWAAAAFALVPSTQMRVMRAAVEAPGLASSINIGAFNMGNALGAAMGAAVLSLGLGYSAVMYVGAILALLSLPLVIWNPSKS
ncbi:MFS transporter [Leeia sp. TBRC 13508]|uniref:MFS transporter n=1 Tax=Leeia speluncae TaxID=2884804 RepID=A0ABS8DB83_9NEIS|nr:MFS transporter [Leeia speluncae]MCB6185402.1 MFS transporter [Leeia speluncae]